VFQIPSETAEHLITYRERAYAALAELKATLGEPPQPEEAGAEEASSRRIAIWPE
jgi:hypothetical protein